MATVESLRFLTADLAREVRRQAGTPVYVYDSATLKANAAKVKQFPHAFGLTARFAMKSCPNGSILKLFHNQGLHFDASSVFEAERAMTVGVPAENISLSTQELGEGFTDLVSRGVKVNVCSVRQLHAFGKSFPGTSVGVRFNPGLGSGGTNKTNVGGPAASFGVWHEFLDEIIASAAEHSLTIDRIHTHIGSGSDPLVWQRVAEMSLEIVKKVPTVTTLNLGGGYKVARMTDDPMTDLDIVGEPVKAAFERFAEETGRKLHLEIEPGTFLVANAGSLITTIQDKVSTGAEGYSFVKLDAGMTDLLRPSLYGAQHPLVVVKADSSTESSNEEEAVVVVGHCCESGDLFTCANGDPDTIATRQIATSEPGDIMVIEGCGAYCSSMSTKNYNSFPECPEVLVDGQGTIHFIRQRQTLQQIIQNEVEVCTEALQ